MSKVLIVAMTALALAACSNQHSRRGEAFDRAGQEIDAAANSKANRSKGDVLGQAMVPPLQIDQPAPAKPEPRFNLAVNNAPVEFLQTLLDDPELEIREAVLARLADTQQD